MVLFGSVNPTGPKWGGGKAAILPGGMRPPWLELTLSSSDALCIASVVCVSILFLRKLCLLLRAPTRSLAPGIVLVLTHSPGVQSPRALAHALAINSHTDLRSVFVAEAPLPGKVRGVAIGPAAATASVRRRTPLALLGRLLRGALALWRALDEAGSNGPVRAIVVNVPPTLPTLPVALLWARLRTPRAHVVVDWHNTASSILRTTGASARIVALVDAAERACARCADAHWCVSTAFAEYLRGWGVRAAVVRDAPPAHFRSLRAPADAPAAHQLLRRVAAAAGPAAEKEAGLSATHTACTEQTDVGDQPRWRSDGIRVAVSSTSWTPDEDFDVLFDALCMVEKKLAPASTPRLLLVITGRGPLRSMFEKRVEEAKFSAVCVWFAWLAAADYPLLLGVADVGICMHSSSSGLDLPMKVVDMLGCGLPVVAFRYKCIGELVAENEDGLLFDDAPQLADALFGLLFQDVRVQRLGDMRANVLKLFPRQERWDAAWKRDAMPTLIALIGDGVQNPAKMDSNVSG